MSKSNSQISLSCQHRIRRGHSHNRILSPTLRNAVFMILAVFILLPIIYILGSPTTIHAKNIKKHPLFEYFEVEFAENNLTPKKSQFYSKLFSASKSEQKGKNAARTRQMETVAKKNCKEVSKMQKPLKMINLVYHAEQSHHYDNWILLGEYVSYLVNQETDVVQKKIYSDKFHRLYNQFDEHSELFVLQENLEGQESEYTPKDKCKQKAQRQENKVNRANFFKFSEQFELEYESQGESQQALLERPILYTLKSYIEWTLSGLFDLFMKEQTRKKIKQKSQTWVIWFFNLEGESQKGIEEDLSILQKRYPQDRFVVLSLHPIMSQKKHLIDYFPTKKSQFEELLVSYLGMSKKKNSANLKVVSRHYEYSLLKLSKDVKDQETFTMESLVGRSEYKDLRTLPRKYVSRVRKVCLNEKLQKENPFFMDSLKSEYFRMGLYELEVGLRWKSKSSKLNFEFQAGIVCKHIPTLHSLLQIQQQILNTHWQPIQLFISDVFSWVFSSKYEIDDLESDIQDDEDQQESEFGFFFEEDSAIVTLSKVMQEKTTNETLQLNVTVTETATRLQDQTDGRNVTVNRVKKVKKQKGKKVKKKTASKAPKSKFPIKKTKSPTKNS